MNINNNIAINLYKQMLRIRMIEERIADDYPKGNMRTPIHFSIGQEAVSVGVCAALNDSDSVFASHRCHSAYFAKGGCLKAMLAELFGRIGGVNRGRSGSAHLSSPENSMFAAPILAGMIPVAVGAALSYLLNKEDKVSIVFFGDAAVEEGVFFESINFAVLKRLPVLFVCENNFFSTHTHIKYRQPDISICSRIKKFGLKSEQIDGNDVVKVYETAGKLIRDIRSGKGPAFMECLTYRYREHVGPDFDYWNPYRTKEEVEAWIKRCPVKRLEKYLIKADIFSLKDIDKERQKINQEIDTAMDFARKSEWPGSDELLNYVY